LNILGLKNTIQSTSEEEVAVYKKIEAYISGELTNTEVEELWEYFIVHPQWYSQFEIALFLKSMT